MKHLISSVLALTAAAVLALPACDSSSDGGDTGGGDTGGDTGAGDTGAGDTGVSGGDTDTAGGDTDRGDAFVPSGDTYTLPGGDVNSTGPIPATDICRRTAEVVCQGEQLCCSSPSALQDCIDNYAGCDTSIFQDSRTGYDPAIARTVLDTFLNYASTCDLGVTAWGGSDSGFLSMLAGTLATDGDCSPNGIDPAAGAACLSPNVCQLSPGIPNLNGICAPRSVLNEPCYTDVECETDLRCDPPNNFLFGGGTCIARLTNTESCNRNGDCLTLNCASGSCADVTADSAYCRGN